MKTSVKMIACLAFLISLLAVSCNPAGNSTAIVQEPPDPGPGDDNRIKFEVEYEDDSGNGVGDQSNWKVTNGTPTNPDEIPPGAIQMLDIKIVSWNPTCIQIGNRLWCQ